MTWGLAAPRGAPPFPVPLLTQCSGSPGRGTARRARRSQRAGWGRSLRVQKAVPGARCKLLEPPGRGLNRWDGAWGGAPEARSRLWGLPRPHGARFSAGSGGGYSAAGAQPCCPSGGSPPGWSGTACEPRGWASTTTPSSTSTRTTRPSSRGASRVGPSSGTPSSRPAPPPSASRSWGRTPARRGGWSGSAPR